MTAPRPTHPTRTCPACQKPYTPTRSHQQVCSVACRQRKKRGTCVLTDEDRAAIRRVLERDGHGHPRRDPLTPDDVAAHVLATARSE